MIMRNLTYLSMTLLLVTITTVRAQGVPHMRISIPVMPDGTVIETALSDDLFINSVTYSLAYKNDIDVVSFYDKFFAELGWERWKTKMQRKFPDQTATLRGGEWDSWRVAESDSGGVEAAYAAVWQNIEETATATLALHISDYNSGIFTAVVSVQLAPNVNPTETMKLVEFFGERPENAFLLKNKLGHSPFKLEKLNFFELERLSENDPLVARYLEIVNAILEQYRTWRPE